MNTQEEQLYESLTRSMEETRQYLLKIFGGTIALMLISVFSYGWIGVPFAIGTLIYIVCTAELLDHADSIADTPRNVAAFRLVILIVMVPPIILLPMALKGLS